MKLLAKTLTVLLTIYLVFWAGLALYFSYAERHTSLLENNLSSVFERTVTIKKITTSWNGFSPIVQIDGFEVAGDSDAQPALAFDTLSAQVSGFSILALWPQLTEFAIERPSLEIVSLPGNRLQIAGITLKPNRSSAGINPKRLISWLLNHQSAVWHDGEIVWRRLSGEIQRYSDVSFVYQRDQQRRTVRAAVTTPKGPVAFRAETNGDVLAADNWDANFEILGDKGQRLLAPDDLSLVVQDGQGSLQLKRLDIQRIQDLLLITGLSEAASWVLDAQLSGLLHDVAFDFSGPLLKINDWSLTAFASQVGFEYTARSPAMNNLAGKVRADAGGGSFEFSANNTHFNWPKWFASELPITRAEGKFGWNLMPDGGIEIVLENGFFEDQVTKIWGINAKIEVDAKQQKVSNLAQLFKVKSVADLSYEQGSIVDPEDAGQNPLFLNAQAEFEVKSLPNILRYLPKDPRIEKFHTWWLNAFNKGFVDKGTISYLGEISKNALKVGKAELHARAEGHDLEIDYGYQKDWPILRNGEGTVVLRNDLLTIEPKQAWLGKDKILAAGINIESIFWLDRQLNLTGQIALPLQRAIPFLFDGPLMKKQTQKRLLPISASAGQVLVDLVMTMPLAKVRDTQVTGTATITNGSLMLPSGVPITHASAVVKFTERSAESANIRAVFLNGVTTAELTTTEVAQPPKLKVSLAGNADIRSMEPWLGKHMLSWLDGTTSWHGDMDIDGSQITINTESNLEGVAITAPEPLAKSAEQSRPFLFSMQVGGPEIQKKLSFAYDEQLFARFEGDTAARNNLLDNSAIYFDDSVDLQSLKLKPGVNFVINDNQLDLDNWLGAIIDLAKIEPDPAIASSTEFLDAMRSIKISCADPTMLGRQFGKLEISALSVDGFYWIGSLNGDNTSGTLHAEPRAETSKFRFNLSRLYVPEASQIVVPHEPIDRDLEPAKYPQIELVADSFRISNKSLGRLEVKGSPAGDEWKIDKFEMIDQGISTKVTGQWVNNSVAGSLSSFAIDTVIDSAGGVLDEMEFDGLIRKGDGTLKANIFWMGAPHEFDFSYLNGDFSLKINDGELVRVESGGGKLLGLLNFNSIARRLIFDFSDVFASGVEFDRMSYDGVLADGEAIMREAYILTSAAFVHMQGKVNLDKETIDMEIHVAPDLAGNLTLISALANPAAGALVFLGQQIFKDQMRSSSYKSYRARGTWEEFELVEFDSSDGQAVKRTQEQSGYSAETGSASDVLPENVNQSIPDPITP